MTFAIGDRVTWESQAAGKTARKEGMVYCKVPPNWYPTLCMQEQGIKGRINNPGAPRDHESYVIHATIAGRKGSRLYWPRVGALKGVSK